MTTKHYLLVLWGDIEPELRGPFPTEEERDAAALELRAAWGRDHGLYPMSVDKEGRPVVGAYCGGFFDDDESEQEAEE